MTALTLLKYLTGNAAAIRRVASSPVAVPVGILLVFSAGVARNYDQMDFRESLAWLYGPLLFSLVSGLWLCLFCTGAWKGSDPYPAGRLRRAVSFFGLFWLTAPIAWLYALPVERWCEPATAARWNLTLLTVVSLWRVLLIGRVVSVMGEMSFRRGVAKVLLPASIEALVIGFHSVTGRAVMAGMGGLRNSPAEEVMLRGLSNAMTVGIIALLVSLSILARTRGQPCRTEAWAPEPGPQRWRLPWVFLLCVAAGCVLVSIRPQEAVRRNTEAARLAGSEDWKGLVHYLSKHRKEQFAPALTLPPSPYELRSSLQVPEVVMALEPDTSPWVVANYLASFEGLVKQPGWFGWSGNEQLPHTLLHVSKLPGGLEMKKRCEETLMLVPNNHRPERWKLLKEALQP